MDDLLKDFLDKRIEKTDTCWIWRGSIHRLGYGIFGFRNKKSINAHKFIYEALVGRVPGGLELDHLCKNRACVNPSHLEPVTHKENMARGAHAAKTHCPKGHEYTADNISLFRNRRSCKECHRVANREYARRTR